MTMEWILTTFNMEATSRSAKQSKARGVFLGSLYLSDALIIWALHDYLHRATAPVIIISLAVAIFMVHQMLNTQRKALLLSTWSILNWILLSGFLVLANRRAYSPTVQGLQIFS